MLHRVANFFLCFCLLLGSSYAEASKILKNTTSSAVVIPDVGQTVPANGTLTISSSDYTAYAGSSNTITFVGAGTLVVNDGSADLSIADGTNLIQGIYPTSVSIKDATSSNVAAVKPGATAPQVGDKSLVVAISPNSPISVTSVPPVDENLVGTITAACASGVSCGAGSTVVVPSSGYTTMGFETHGTWSATMTQDISYDANCSDTPNSVLWFGVSSLDNMGSAVVYSSSWGPGMNNHPWVMNVAGAQCARLRASAYTSGTVAITVDTGVGTSVLWTVPTGNVASGSADSGNPIKVGGRYNLTPLTLTDGARADLQLDGAGQLKIRNLDKTVDAVSAAQGTAASNANGWPVKPGDGANSQTYTSDGEAKVLVTPLTNSSVVKSQIQDDAGTGLTSQANGPQQALDVGINVAGAQVDPRDRTWNMSSASDSAVAVQGAASSNATGWFVKPGDGTNSQAYTASGESKALVTPLTNSSVVKSQLQDDAGASVVLGQTTMTDSLPVTLASDQTPLTAAQGAPNTAANGWPTMVTDGTNTSAVKAASEGAVVADPALVVSLSPNSPLNGITGPISLPTGAATDSNQATGNASLASIDSKASTTNSSLATIATNTTGAATAANQASGNASLASIDIKVPAQGQAAMAGSTPVVIASDQSPIPITGTIMSTTASVGTTGSAVPGSADFVGGKDPSGNLQGMLLDTGGSLQVAGEGTPGTPAGGVASVQGVAGGQELPISVAALPLPSGAATSANQSTANASLASVDGKMTTTGNGLKVDVQASALPSGAATLVAQGTGNTSLSSIDTKLSSQATAANQATANASLSSIDGKVSTTNTTLATISGQLPATIGAQVMTGSLAVNVASDQVVPVSLTSVPLASGAATAANQITGNTTLSTIATNTTGVATAANQSTANGSLATIVTNTTGVATAANQTTGNTSLSSIDTKTPALVTGRVPVDGSGVTQPVSAASLPLPTGASTAAKQPALGTAGTASTDILSVQGIAGMVALKVDGSAVTQPVSAASLPLPSGAATLASQSTGNISLSSIDTKTPSLVSGRVPVDGSGVTQPVSGTVTANAGTGTFAVSAASLPLPTGASTAAKQPALGTAGTSSSDVISVQGIASMTALKVDGSAVTQPVSAASLPLPSGAATSALQTTGNTTLSSISGQLPATLGQKTMANSEAVTFASDQSPLPVTGTFFQATQPVSGTVTANAGTGTFAVSAAALPLPSGASTAAKQPALGTAGTPSTDVLTVQGATSMTALKVDGSGVTQPISASALPLPSGAATSANQTTAITSLGTIDTDIKASQPRKLQDGAGNAVTSQASGGQRALDVGINVAGTQVDPRTRTWSLTSGTDSTTAVQGTAAATAGAWPTKLTDGTTVAGVTVGNALKTDGSATTQPISAASLPLPTGAATETTLAKLPLAQASSTSGQSGPLGQGAVTTGSPTYTTGQTDPLSLTTAGALRVDASGTTQPVSGTVTVTQATGTNLHAVVDSSALPTGAATSAAQTTGNSTLATLSGQLPTTLGQKTAANALAVVTQGDEFPSTQNVTTQDLVSTSVTGANSQNFITGTPTAGSVATFSLASWQSAEFQVTGTWTGTLVTEVSVDGGTTWFTHGIKQEGSTYTGSTFTANFAGFMNIANLTNVRVRATAAMTGTAVVKVTTSANVSSVTVSNPLTLRDSTVQSVGDTIKAASTAAVATDSALVVSLSPNSPSPMASDKTGSGTITATDGAVVAQTSGSASLNFVVSGTWSATLNIEASNDNGVTWFSIAGDIDATDSIVNNFNVNGLVSIPSGGYPLVRLRANPYTSGTVNVSWAASVGVSLVEVFNTNAASLLAQVSGPTLTSIDNKTPSLGQTTQALSMPTIQPGDFTSSVGSITVQDTGSASTAQGSQTVITGTPTAGSTFQTNTNSYNSVVAKISGTWTGSVQLEQSVDGGTSWIAIPTRQSGGSIFATAYTTSIQIEGNVAAKGTVRIRAASAMTGTASVQFTLSYNNNGTVFVNNAVRITDGANSSVATPLTILAASTAAGTGNTSAVVALSPNSPLPPGTNVIGATTADGTIGSAIPSAAHLTGASDGTNTRAVGAQTSTTNPVAGSYFIQTVPMTYSFNNLTGAATTTVKSGAGTLHEFCINNDDVSATAAIFDNTAGSGTHIATITNTLGGGATISTNCLLHDVAFSTGLTVVTTGATANYTVIYK